MHATSNIASHPTIRYVFRFELQAVCPETGARAGILHTAHGDVETPVFMPVGTQATVKGVLPRDLIEDLDAKIILATPIISICGRGTRPSASLAGCTSSCPGRGRF